MTAPGCPFKSVVSCVIGPHPSWPGQLLLVPLGDLPLLQLGLVTSGYLLSSPVGFPGHQCTFLKRRLEEVVVRSSGRKVRAPFWSASELSEAGAGSR